MAFDELREEFSDERKSAELELDEAKSKGESKGSLKGVEEVYDHKREFDFQDESKPLEMSSLMSSMGNEKEGTEWI